MKLPFAAIALSILPLAGQVTWTASWIGNSYNSPGKWVQSQILDIYVAPDGTVFTDSIWDEGGREAGIYKDGDVVGNIGGTHGDGTGGRAVTANSKFVFVAVGKGGLYGFTQRPIKDPENSPVFVVVNQGKEIAGLAADETRLFVSNPVTNQVLVYDIATLTQTGAFPLMNAGKLVVDRAGTLWIIQGKRVVHYTADGAKLADEITDAADPRSLAIDNQGKLMVGDGKTGIGMDAEGNRYEATSLAGTDLRKYRPDGTLVWRLLGLEAVDTAVVDPATGGADVYTKEEHFTMDYTQPPGKEATLKAVTVDPVKYPNDPRIATETASLNLSAIAVRNLAGGKYLYLTDQLSKVLLVYRLDGDTAAPVEFRSTFHIPGWLPGVQPEKGRWTWRDANGDGDFQASEFSDADGVNAITVWSQEVDENGTIWQADEVAGIRGGTVNYGTPAPFTSTQRAKYVAATDTLYVSGYTTLYPKDPGELNFGQAGTELARYDRWSEGNRTPAWRIVLPYNAALNVTVKSIAVEGDLVIAGMFVKSKGSFLYLYDARTGMSLGQIAPGTEINTVNGLIDGTQLLEAYKRGDEYLIFVEEVTWSEVAMYRVKVASPFAYHAPVAGVVTPDQGSGASQAFTLTATDADGAADLSFVHMHVGATQSNPGNCSVLYIQGTNTLALVNDGGGDWAGLLTPGSGTASNSQCTLDAGASAVTVNGNSLTVRLGLTFAATYVGTKNVYVEAVDNEGLTSGLQLRGTWTGAPNQAPAAGTVTPSGGTGDTQTFTLTYTDPNGAADIRWGLAYWGSDNGAGAICMAYYDRPSGQLLLLDDTGQAWLAPVTAGVAGTVENSQCVLDAGGSAAAVAGNTLTVKLAMKFKPAFAGVKKIYMNVLDNGGLGTGNVERGTWTVPGPASQPPVAVSVTPNAGSGASQTFSFVYSDPAGAANLEWVGGYFTRETAICYVYYIRAGNALYLSTAAGWTNPVAPGSAGTVESDLCAVDVGKSSAVAAGSNLTLNVAMTFKAALAGQLAIWMYAVNKAGLNSDAVGRGQWTVAGGQ